MKNSLKILFLTCCTAVLFLGSNHRVKGGISGNYSADFFKSHGDSLYSPLYFINTTFENASPLEWEIDENGSVVIGLLYDHERNSPNRASGHWHFQVQAKPGSDLTLILKNFDNVWNGKTAVPISDRSICFVSLDGKKWKAIPTEKLPGNRLKFQIHMEQENLYVAKLEPYRISDLEALKSKIKPNPHIEITQIGQTIEGRPIEIIRLGNPDTPNRIFIRARAHAWEPGGNWVVQGLIQSLLQDDEKTKRYLEKYSLYILPMANKDAVARGRTRFNGMGMDLNRNWDKPADPEYAPENHAVEEWLKTMINKGKKPDLAIDLHNDRGGNLHISRPNIHLDAYLANMERFEALLYKHTWFTEGSTGKNFRNPGTIGEGLVERFGIDAFVYELNCEWIAGLQKVPFGKDWELLGEQLGIVFFEYFNGD